MPTPSERIASLQRQREAEAARYDRALSKIDAELEMLTRFGEDRFPNGSIIAWHKRFGGGSRVYTYAAIKADDLWNTTGPQSPKAYRWEELLPFVLEGLQGDLYVITQAQPMGVFLNSAGPWPEHRRAQSAAEYDDPFGLYSSLI